jgi:hypothetical protein
MSVSETRPDVSQDAPADETYAKRPLTLAENIVLTFKVLAVMGLVGVALWAAKLWTAVD